MSITKTQQQEFDCPECGHSLTIDTAETWCPNCGVVVEEDKIDLDMRTITQDTEQNTGRGVTTQASHDKGLGSQISMSDTDANSNIISSESRTTFSRLREYQRDKQFDSKELHNRRGMAEVHRFISAMDLPQRLVSPSAKLFNEAHKEDLSIGLSLDAIADACVFITARVHGNIRDMDEWVEMAMVKERDLKTALSKVQTELDIGYLPPTPTDYVDRFADELNLKAEERKQVVEILKDIEKTNVNNGRKPQGVVGAVIYLVTSLTQGEICDVVGVSENTLRKAMNAIKDSEVNL